VLRIPTNLALKALPVLAACALTGCAKDHAPAARQPIPPAVEAMGRPQLATTQAASLPTEQTIFAKLADEACGLSGGCLVGASHGMLEGHRIDLARKANEHAEVHPAVPADARNSKSADLNGDGFVTLDEVIAMRRAGLDDQEMIDRLQATRQVFCLSPLQWRYLYDRGINLPVLDWMSNNGTTVASADHVH
jgi:hypothetical protein